MGIILYKHLARYNNTLLRRLFTPIENTSGSTLYTPQSDFLFRPSPPPCFFVFSPPLFYFFFSSSLLLLLPFLFFFFSLSFSQLSTSSPCLFFFPLFFFLCAFARTVILTLYFPRIFLFLAGSSWPAFHSSVGPSDIESTLVVGSWFLLSVIVATVDSSRSRIRVGEIHSCMGECRPF